MNETRARDFRIGSMVLHLDYDPATYANDIGLIRIERPTLFNSYIWPVCMPPLNEDWTGRSGIVMGWGTQKYGGAHSRILMEVKLIAFYTKRDLIKIAFILIGEFARLETC